MPLQLNLLHEEIQEQRQRQRDPLKISMFVGIGIAALLAVNYLWGGYKVLHLKSQLSAAEREWSKIEPKVTEAQKRAEELNTITRSTAALDQLIDARFYWAPLLEKIARCVTPNLQLLSLDGSTDSDKDVQVTLEGTAAGREPRAVAEDFRQMLLEQLGKVSGETKVEFRSLEDSEAVVNIGGANVPSAHFTLLLNFNPGPKKVESTVTPEKRKRRGEDKND